MYYVMNLNQPGTPYTLEKFEYFIYSTSILYTLSHLGIIAQGVVTVKKEKLRGQEKNSIRLVQQCMTSLGN